MPEFQTDPLIDPRTPTGLPPGQPSAPSVQTPQPATERDYLVSQGLIEPGREDEWRRINEQRGQIEQQAAGNINARMGAVDRMITAPIAKPAAPRLQDVPKPPQYQYRDAMQAFQSPAVLLATLGSLFTRRSAVNALTAGAAAMNGFMEGDKEKVAREEKNWQNAVEATIAQNQKEINQFNMAMSSARLNIADRDARLNAIFAANKDEMGLAALRTGSMERLQQFQEMKIKAQDALVNSIERYNAQKNIGLIDESTLKDMVQRYIDNPSERSRIMTGLHRNPINFSNFQEMLSKDPRATGTMLQEIDREAKAAQSMATSGARVLGSRIEQLNLIEREVLKAAPDALASAEKVPRGKWVPLNKIIQQGKVVTSDPDLKEFALQNIRLAELWARSFNPTGVMRIDDRDFALAQLLTTESKGTYKRAVDTITYQIKRNREAASELKAGMEPDTKAGPGVGAEQSSDGWTTVSPNVRIRERK